MTLSRRMSFSSVIFCSTALLGTLGCGSSKAPDFLGQLAPVSGIIRVNGQPMAGVQVTMVPYQGIRGNKSDKSVRLATAVTDDAGKYVLLTPPGGAVKKNDMDQYSGVLPGKYAATFSCWIMPDGKPWATATEKQSQGPVAMGAVEKLPPQLGNPLTTPHIVDINETGSFSLDFDLKVK